MKISALLSMSSLGEAILLVLETGDAILVLLDTPVEFETHSYKSSSVEVLE
jgi:hypothetical protein